MSLRHNPTMKNARLTVRRRRMGLPIYSNCIPFTTGRVTTARSRLLVTAHHNEYHTVHSKLSDRRMVTLQKRKVPNNGRIQDWKESR